jgi:GT2 family glycosyltransferase
VLFIDDDVVPVTGMIERHLEHHRRESHMVVTGPMVEPPGLRLAPWLRWEAIKLQKQYDAMVAGLWAPTPRQFYTANASVRREHALRVGGFDECFTRAEDVEFAYRLADHGLSFRFDPAAAVLHEPDRSFSSWLRVPYEYGRYDVLMEQRGRRHIHLAVSEERGRHPLNRLLPRWCVGRRWRYAVVSMLAAAIRRTGPSAAERVQLALCSAAWNVQYWQGVADMSGRGAALWRDIGDGLFPRLAERTTDAMRRGVT